MINNLNRTELVTSIYSFTPMAMKICNGQKEDAEDLLHDAFLRLYYRPYEDVGKLRQFLSTVIMHMGINRWKKEKTKRRKNLEYRLFHITEYSFIEDFEDRRITDKVKGKIAAFVYNLSERDRAIFELYLDKVKFKDIASLYGMNINAVLAIVQRIKNKIIYQSKNILNE